jgi:hypothetical protein
MLVYIGLIFTLLVAPSPLTARTQPRKPPPKSTARALQKDAAEEVFAKTASKIVFLITRKSGDLHSSASGVILSADGYIATNYHALQGADAVEIRFFPDAGDSDDYRSFNGAKLLYADPDRDIAVLKVNSKNLPFLECQANTKCEARIGENIYAIGNPKGLSNTISEGIVSGLRSLEGEDVIQHTAPISPGSSGGALVDSSGALLGMNSWQVTDGQNLNFAISSKHLLAALTSARQATTAVGFPPDAPAENETETPTTPTNASSIPQYWVDPKESPEHAQDIRISAVDDYVYLEWTISAALNVDVQRKETCDTKKTRDEWEGNCVVAFTVESVPGSGHPICVGIEQHIIITLLTRSRIEGKIQHLEFPKDFPLSCPVVVPSDWRTFAMIPKF